VITSIFYILIFFVFIGKEQKFILQLKNEYILHIRIKRKKGVFMKDLLIQIKELEKEYPYKIPGNPDTYSSYHEAWQDCLNRVVGIIESYQKDDDWIPVHWTEGGWSSDDVLPKEKENEITHDFCEYEVTFQSDNILDIRHYKFGRGHFWHGPQIVDKYIIAWRKCPEPYKGD